VHITVQSLYPLFITSPGYVLYPSYFKLPARWLFSLTPVTYSCTLPGIRCVAAFMQLELLGYRRDADSGSVGKKSVARRAVTDITYGVCPHHA